jgi:hypothetical protein
LKNVFVRNFSFEQERDLECVCVQLWFEAKSQCNMEVSLEQQEVLLQKHNKICKLFNQVFLYFF